VRFKISVVGADPRVRPWADTWVGPYGGQFRNALLAQRGLSPSTASLSLR
jgi:hypothetical protein